MANNNLQVLNPKIEKILEKDEREKYSRNKHNGFQEDNWGKDE